MRLVEKDKAEEFFLPNNASRRNGAASSLNQHLSESEIGAQKSLAQLKKSTVQAHSIKENHFVKCYESI